MQLQHDKHRCGVDEAGRGPLAGAVYAAAVILDPAHPIAGLNDSKKISEKKRIQLEAEIITHALSYSVAFATVAEIDKLNILRASLLAMQRAVDSLTVRPASAIVDGLFVPMLTIPAVALVDGDSLVAEISAASILAKNARDRYMVEMCTRYPQYGFTKHKGYGTRVHMASLKEHGPCPIHRFSFAPVRVAFAQKQLSKVA